MANHRGWTEAVLPLLDTNEASTPVEFVRTGSKETASLAGDSELLKLVRELREEVEKFKLDKLGKMVKRLRSVGGLRRLLSIRIRMRLNVIFVIGQAILRVFVTRIRIP